MASTVDVAKISVNEVLFGPVPSQRTVYFAIVALADNPAVHVTDRVVLATYFSAPGLHPTLPLLQELSVISQLGGDSSVFVVGVDELVRPRSSAI